MFMDMFTKKLTPEEQFAEEQHKVWQNNKDQLLAIKDSAGYKLIVQWFENEERNLDNKLTKLRGQELEVAVQVRHEVKGFLSYLKNQTS